MQSPGDIAKVEADMADIMTLAAIEPALSIDVLKKG